MCNNLAPSPAVPAESFVEGIARPAHGANGIRLGLGRQSLAQAADVDVDGALVDLGRQPLDAVELTPATRLLWPKWFSISQMFAGAEPIVDSWQKLST
jgi:hypothetical protein